MTECQRSDLKTYDIVIVGGGMVGAALACSLVLQKSVRENYRIALVEAQNLDFVLGETESARSIRQDTDINGFENRVSALTAASQCFLNQLGVWENIQSQSVCPYENMHVWDGDGTGHIQFSAAELYQPALGHIVENGHIVRALHRRLSQLNKQYEGNGIDVFSGLKIKAIRPGANGGGELVFDDQEGLRASLIVAADGAHSLVRKAFSIPTREWDYNHHAIVATVKTEKPHCHTAWQRFSPSGPLAFLPLHTGVANEPQHYSSIVWSQLPERCEALMALDDQAFCATLGSEFEQRLGNVLEVSKRYSIPLRQRHAKTYIGEGVVLLGDAAHTIHPLAGQGVNLGFLDVAVLADELGKAAVSKLRPENEFTLRRYQRRRMGSNLAMMGLMEGFKQLFAADDVGVRWIRNTGMKWLNGKGFLKNQVVSQAMGLNVTLPELKSSAL